MGTSLTGNNISQSYLGLLKSTDSQALTSSEKRLTDGAGNVGIGFATMIANTSGNFNVGIGLTSLKSNTTGDKNIAIGNDSLEANQTGSFNTAIGNESLKELSSGGHNIAIGNNAGNGITTGSQSIIIGSEADASDVTSQNEIVIGYNLSGNGSNTVTIGNSSITTNYFNGNILLGNSSKLLFGTTDVYISGTTVSDNIQLGLSGSTKFTFAQTTGLRMHDYGSGSITGTVTQRLGVTSTGQVVEIPIGGGAVDGSGTANDVVMWSDSNTITDAPISISSNDATFAGKITSSDDIIISNSSPELYMTTGGTHRNWLLAAQESIDGGFEIASQPSGGGSYNVLFAIRGDTGNVAIGGTTANAKLHISGISQTGTVNAFKIDNNTSNTKFAIDSVSGDYKLQFKNAGNTVKVLLNSNGDSYFTGGNIGISTSTPVTLLDLSNGNSQGDGIGFGSNLSEIRRGNSGANLQMSHFGNISMIIDSDNNDSARFFNVMHGNNDSASATELFRVQETGEVLIGTTSASSIFTLKYDDATTLQNNSASGITIRNTNNTSGSGATITFEHTDATTGVVAKIGAINDPSTTDDNGILTFSTRKIGVGMVRQMTIDSDGLVAIGTTSPRAILDLKNSGDGTLNTTASNYQILLEAPQGTDDLGRNIGWAVGGGTVNASINAVDNGASNATGLVFSTGAESGMTTALTLDSSQNANFAGNVNIENASTPLLTIKDTTNNVNVLIGADDTNTFIRGSSGSVFLQTNGSNTAMTLDSSQRVGIGTTSPSATLHVVGGDVRAENRAFFAGRRDASAPAFSFHDDSDTGMFGVASNILAFATAGSERMRITSGGNVSVNQASSDAPLQVRQTRDTNGNMRTNGTYAFIAEGNDDGAVGEGIGIHLTGKRTNGSAVRGVSLLSLIQNTGNAHDLVIATSDSASAPAERARVTDVGDFIVGKSTIAVTSTGVEARASGLFVATRNAGTAGIFNREGTTKGNIVDIRQDNSPVLTLGTTGDNVFLSGTANSNDLLLRTNAQNRIRILDYGLTKFDTYGLVTTTPDGRMHQHQIFTMSCTSATSTTAKAMANVGTTNAFDYTIIARIDATNIGSIAGRTATANGTNSGFFSRSAFNGNVTAITPTYNASSDTLDVAVTYSGSTAPTVSITINGISDVDISRTGGCST